MNIDEFWVDFRLVSLCVVYVCVIERESVCVCVLFTAIKEQVVRPKRQLL